MLGYLLARAGVRVLVLEKHADFLRDFRGDTIHPSTLELLAELGLLERFLALPHDEVTELAVEIEATRYRVADFTHLPVRHPRLVFLPQWHFLDFLRREAERFPGFALALEAEADELVSDGGRIAGVVARTRAGRLVVRADLVVAADGRGSTLRARAGLAVDELGAPMDVLWFRVSRRPGDPAGTGGNVARGAMLVRIDRGEHWQLGYVIPKGSAEAIRARGIDAFRARVAALVPFLAERMDEIARFDDVKLLTVQVNRARRWQREGLLCIGDAAHAMSPVGGVGINLAIQDAVAAANRLAAPLRAGTLTLADLEAVQRRRELPTRITQRLQLAVQRRLVAPVLGASAPLRAPLALRLLDRVAWLRRLPARLVGLGVRPEHVRTPALGDARGAGYGASTTSR